MAIVTEKIEWEQIPGTQWYEGRTQGGGWG